MRWASLLIVTLPLQFTYAAASCADALSSKTPQLENSRTEFSLSNLELLVGKDAAATIAYSTVSSQYGTWLLFSRVQNVFFLTAGHVAFNMLHGLTGVASVPLKLDTITDANKVKMIAADIFPGTQHIEKNQVFSLLLNPIEVPTNEDQFLMGNVKQDFSFGLVLPGAAKPEFYKALDSGDLQYDDLTFQQVVRSPEEKAIIDIQNKFPMQFSETVNIGDQVLIPGFPQNMKPSLSIGHVIDSKSPDLPPFDPKVPFDPASEFVVNAIATPGNSGGPVFDFKGRLLGIVVRANATDDVTTGIAKKSNFVRVLKIGAIVDQIAKGSTSLQAAEKKSGQATMFVTYPDLIKMLKDNFVCP